MLNIKNIIFTIVILLLFYVILKIAVSVAIYTFYLVAAILIGFSVYVYLKLFKKKSK